LLFANMVIGVTGQIGAGKSEAARILKKMGAAVIDADQIGRYVVDKNDALRRKLVKAFGSDIMDRRGALRRGKLAAIAFASSKAKAKLDQLVHPYLLRELRACWQKLGTSNRVIVIDAALLLNWNFDREIDRTLLIHCSRELRMKRLIKRGMSPQDAMQREAVQLPYAEYRKRADRIILNNRSIADLKRKVTTWARPFFAGR
jgi:dephospho-CoA kinase